MTGPTPQVTKRNNILIFIQSTQAFVGYLTAGGVLLNFVDPKWSALALGINGALSQAMGVWVARTTPLVEAQDAPSAP